MYEYEVLAPAGKFESIVPLIKAGANAIYVGLEAFSSRPSWSDFSIQDIKCAVELCHQQDTRLYVAINGCVSEQSIGVVYDKLQELDGLGVDAMILSDWGVLTKANLFVQHAELHASTLLGTHNAQTIRYLKEIGVKRTVLSTNLYLDEIATIVNAVPEMEFELVADGGICFNDNRICELPHRSDGENYSVGCRQMYDLHWNGQKASAKAIAARQISICEVVDMYLELGIMSFKIEGRTVDYKYIVPRVKALQEALKTASARNYTDCSMLHYVSERKRRKAE